jgi:hypothetical protein
MIARFRAAFGIIVAVALLLAPRLVAEVHLVEPGNDPNTALFTAIQAAADGDTIMLMPGGWTFPSQTADPVNLQVSGKGLTIIAAPGTHPELWTALIRNVPAGSQVVLRGVDFKMHQLTYMLSGGGAIWVENCAGAVWIEDCDALAGDQAASGTFLGSNVGWAGLSVYECAAVSVVRCSLTGGKGANDFPSPANPAPATMGGAGLQIYGSKVTVHDGVMLGGAGGLGGTLSAGAPSGPGVLTSPLFSSSVLVAGGSATGGDSTGVAPGDGVLVYDATSSVWLRDVTVAAGAGAGSAMDIDAPPGTVEILPAPPRSLQMPATLHESSTGTMVIDGVQGDLVALFASPKGAVQFFPGKQGAFLLGFPLSASFVLGPNPVPGGHWSINFGAPALPPSVQSVTVLLQLVVHDGTRLLFEGGSAITVLDSLLP